MGKLGLGCVALIVVIAVILGISMAGTYNRLVTSGQAVDAQWANVESAYQRRADLIPNLVSTVQGAANFEKSTLEAVINARASVGRARTAQQRAGDGAGRSAREISPGPRALGRAVRRRGRGLGLVPSLGNFRALSGG